MEAKLALLCISLRINGHQYFFSNKGHNLLTGIHKMAKMKDLGMNFLAIRNSISISDENKDIDFR